MQVNVVKVNAGRTFNHPMESYSNLRCDVAMEATLEPGEDPAEATKQLQASCERLAEDHKQGMLQSIHDLAAMAARSHKRLSLKRQIETAEAELQQLGPEEVQRSIDFGEPPK